eukprot:jgi/Chlat1/7053/Chrsp56S06711
MAACAALNALPAASVVFATSCSPLECVLRSPLGCAFPDKRFHRLRKQGRELVKSEQRIATSASAQVNNGAMSMTMEPYAQPVVPTLSLQQAVGALSKAVHASASTYLAFYSSVLRGIVTDPAVMVLPIDDHMVHRGHAVFDTAAVYYGKLYQLDQHLDRLLLSASNARVTPAFSREKLRDIIIETATVACERAGHNFIGQARFWLSAGPGGFGLATSECVAPTFYVIVATKSGYPDVNKGLRCVTASVPIKPPTFATVKTTNYLPNALVVDEALQAGADQGVWLDQEGNIGEGASMNIAFMMKDSEFVVPPFDKVLAGITALWAMELASTSAMSDLISKVSVRTVTVDEARGAKEMMMVGSGVLVTPVLTWDNHPINDGTPGPVALRLRRLIEEDMQSGEGQCVPLQRRTR